MRKFFKQLIILISFVIFLILSWYAALLWDVRQIPPLSAEKREQELQKIIKNEDFLEIFERRKEFSINRKTSVYKVTDAVSEYLKACCQSKDEIISLLKKNGFQVSNYSKDDNVKGFSSSKPYDEIIFGGQSKGTIFIIFGKEYRIIVYIKDKKISEVKAYSIFTSL